MLCLTETAFFSPEKWSYKKYEGCRSKHWPASAAPAPLGSKKHLIVVALAGRQAASGALFCGSCCYGLQIDLPSLFAALENSFNAFHCKRPLDFARLQARLDQYSAAAVGHQGIMNNVGRVRCRKHLLTTDAILAKTPQRRAV